MCDFNFKPRPIYVRRSYLYLVKEKPPKAWRDGPAFWSFGATPLMVAQRKLAFACMFRNRNTRPLGRAPSYPLPRITDMDVALMIGEACVAENPRQTARVALQDLGKDVLDIARAGLTARGFLNTGGDNEAGFLQTLDEIVESGKSPAQRMLDRYHGEWGGDISRVYKYSF